MRLRSRFRRSALECRAVGRRLQSYLDGELDDRRRDNIVAHLDACRDCGLESTTYLEIKESLSRERTMVAVDVLDRLRRFSDELVTGEEGDQTG